MNTKEMMREREKVAAAQPMAARAVAVCEGCPLAKFCAIKAVTPCETAEVRTQQVESSGGAYEGASLDKPVTLSYRRQLMDDTIPFVMADLRKKKERQLPPPKPSQKPTIPPRISAPTHRAKTPATPTMPVVRKSPEAPRVGSADILADILVSMIGVSSMSTVRDKKKV